MDALIYIGVIIILIGLGIGGFYAKRKLNIQKEEIELYELILDAIDYINSQFEYKYKDGISLIITYILKAIDFVEQFADDIDMEQRKILVFDKAKEICTRNGIGIENELETIIDKCIDYLLKYYGK